jgi:hypothetical protein
MTLSTFTNIAIARSNLVNPTDVGGITTGNISGFVTGFPASNLEYEDPWTMMKTNGVTSPVTIETDFSPLAASPVPRVVGIINHNLSTAGWTTVMPQRWNGSSWDDLNTLAINIVGDQDMLIVWDSVSASDEWRINLVGSGVSDFYLGSLFWGSVETLATNPIDGGGIQTRTVPLVVERSAGGAKHVSFGAQRRSATLEISFVRAAQGDVAKWQQYGYYDLIGILPPEHGDWGSGITLASGEPFWGYVVDRTFAASGPGQYATAGTQAVYDYTVFLEGAV